MALPHTLFSDNCAYLPDGIVLLDGVEVLVVVVPAADGVDLAPDGGQL